MNPEFSGPPDPHDAARIGQQLCRAVGDVDFDYASLVDGVHHRAGRIRRRRALTTGAVVAVLGPALVGGSALVLPDLLPGGGPGTLTPADTPVAALTETPAPEPPEPSEAGSGSGEAMSAEEGPPTTLMSVQDPPWQEQAPPLPEGGTDEVDPDNAWDVPDARPTGVDHLELFGAPALGGDAWQIPPLSGVMACDHSEVPRGSDPAPLSGQHWMYHHDDVPGVIDIQVTGWEDSAAARDALRDDTMTYCYRDTDGAWERLDWDGREGDDDYLLYRATSVGIDYDLAVVRQGDYLVGVSVSGVTGVDGLEVAAEIADKLADNLAALDPVHGRG